MVNRRKRKQILHVNMLCKWCTPAGDAYWAEEVTDGVDDVIPTWDEGSVPKRGPVLGDQLNARQMEIQELLSEYPDVARDSPGRTTLAEHWIHTGLSPPTRQPPYTLAHAHRDMVEKEL